MAKKLQDKKEIKDFSDYVSTQNELKSRYERELTDLNHQISLCNIQLSQAQSQISKEKAEAKNYIEQQKAVFDKKCKSVLSDLAEKESNAEFVRKELTDREGKVIQAEKIYENLAKLKAENAPTKSELTEIKKEKIDLVKRRAELEEAEVNLAGLTDREEVLLKDRIIIEKLRSDALAIQEEGEKKILEGNTLLEACAAEKESIIDEKKQLKQAKADAENEKFAIGEKVKELKAVELNVKKIKDGIAPKLKAIEDSEKNLEEKLKELSDRLTKAQKIESENMGVQDRLELKSAQLEQQERDLAKKEEELKRKELLYKTKDKK